MLLKTIRIAALALGLVGAAQPAPAEPVLKLAHVGGAVSGFSAGTKAFAAEVARLSGGRFRIEEFGGSTLGDETAIIKAMKEGTLDLVLTGLSGPFPSFVPEAGVTTLPFLFRNPDHAKAVLDGPIGQGMLDRMRDQGIVGLAWGENGFRQLANNKRPVRTPEDVRGLKLRVPPSEMLFAVWKALGAEVVKMPVADVYEALKSGRVDGQENTVPNAQSYNFFDNQKYLSLINYNYAPFVFLMSPDTHDDLSPEDRKIFVQAARAGGQATRDFNAGQEKQILAAIKAKGVQVIADADRTAFETALKPLIDELGRKYGDLPAKIRDVP